MLDRCERCEADATATVDGHRMCGKHAVMEQYAGWAGSIEHDDEGMKAKNSGPATVAAARTAGPLCQGRTGPCVDGTQAGKRCRLIAGHKGGCRG